MKYTLDKKERITTQTSYLQIQIRWKHERSNGASNITWRDTECGVPAWQRVNFIKNGHSLLKWFEFHSYLVFWWWNNMKRINFLERDFGVLESFKPAHLLKQNLKYSLMWFFYIKKHNYVFYYNQSQSRTLWLEERSNKFS